MAIEAAEARTDVVRAVLRRVPFFARLSPAHLGDLARACATRSVAAGEGLFREGEAAHGFYVVAEGAVKIFRTSADGGEVVIHLLGPGDFIGEVPLHAGGTYPASAEATEASLVVYVPGAAMRETIRRDPDVALRILEGFAGRLLALLGRFESLATRGAAGRLADFLLRLAEKNGRATDRGTEVPLALSRSQIASLVGTSRETVSRLLSTWARKGWIRPGRRTLLLRDAGRLRAVR